MRFQQCRVEHYETVIFFFIGDTGGAECRHDNENECQITDKEYRENLLTFSRGHRENSSSRP